MYILNNTTLRLLSGNIRNVRITNVYDTILFPSLLPSVILESLGISQKIFVVTKKDGKSKVDGNGAWFKFKSSFLLQVMLILSIAGLIRCVLEIFRMGIPIYIVIIFWLRR